MKQISILASLLVAVVATGANVAAAQQDIDRDWANYGRYAEANKTAPKGAGAVFMGNSITDGWAKASPAFFSDNNYIGRGIGGQVTAQMLARFRADVLALEPKCVVIMAGTNDIARNNGYVSLDNICGNIASMAELAKAHKIKVIICSVLPAAKFGWRPQIEDGATQIVQLNELLKQWAAKNGCTYVDYHSALKDDNGGLPQKYAKDGVHPTPEAYAIMESIIKPAVDKALKSKR